MDKEIVIKQHQKPEKIPVRFFQDIQNDPIWTVQNAALLRNFEGSSVCAPLIDYYDQLIQFENATCKENSCCKAFFENVFRMVAREALLRSTYPGFKQASCILAPEADAKPLSTSAMTVLPLIEDMKLKIMRASGSRLMEFPVFSYIGLTFSGSRMVNPDTIRYSLSEAFSRWAWLCVEAKRLVVKREKKQSTLEERVFQAYISAHGNPEYFDNELEPPFEYQGRRYECVLMERESGDLFGRDVVPVMYKGEERFVLEEGDRLVIIDRQMSEHCCILTKRAERWGLMLEGTSKLVQSIVLWLDEHIPCRLKDENLPLLEKGKLPVNQTPKEGEDMEDLNGKKRFG